ncbi:Glycoside hydrolase/deacetylase, beta/alpha-barrel [Metarhizium album ARSEF 1941]|uniref:Glycoside hydrolase/deacetylase, beta/alpha-barrel n=1 Tax=Metarhizium album (strain ARSEF 1941) TaxID=1081103 RepID=A0A0B2X3A6_METAS|nr:Glycoside hydrolase/deacetylase, beta/alpha-barrel [Metarhizium album ARSEF 1941]KHN99770.1 Glycoside hydrolase/deacetylase, beta/alpha-barrel [Metarhizium album ARSEF 1941]
MRKECAAPARDHAKWVPAAQKWGFAAPQPRIAQARSVNWTTVILATRWPMITSCKQPGMVALTFDDGPYIYTEKILSLLSQLKVRATFFITGDNRAKGHIDDPATEWPAILRRMYRAGHQIASHTWTHRDLNKVNETVRRAEIIHNEMAIRNVLGWMPTYIRPPFLECSAGSQCEDTMSDLVYHSISANLDTKDYMYDDPALIQRAKDRYSSTLSRNSKENSYIVLAHDVHEQTVFNLTEFMVNLAKERGYKLVTVGECLGDPEENWYRPAGGSSKIARTVGKGLSCSEPDRPYVAPVPSSRNTGTKISPNQRCGGSTGYVCPGSGFGPLQRHTSRRRDSVAWTNLVIPVDQLPSSVVRDATTTLETATHLRQVFGIPRMAFVALAPLQRASTFQGRGVARDTDIASFDTLF